MVLCDNRMLTYLKSRSIKRSLAYVQLRSTALNVDRSLKTRALWFFEDANTILVYGYLFAGTQNQPVDMWRSGWSINPGDNVQETLTVVWSRLTNRNSSVACNVKNLTVNVKCTCDSPKQRWQNIVQKDLKVHLLHADDVPLARGWCPILKKVTTENKSGPYTRWKTLG